MNFSNRKDLVYLVLAGMFVANAILGEVMGGKLIQAGPFIMSLGVIPWPIVFVATDLINEYFGKPGVRRLTLMTVGLIVYAFIILFIAMAIPAAKVSPVQDEPFRIVFGQSLWIIFGSVIAFLLSQLIDVFMFWLLRDRTRGRHLWLRATGSTAVSQLVDTWVILGIAFWLPGKISASDYVSLALTNYIYKFGIAVSMTPVIYGVHFVIDRFLGRDESQSLIASAVAQSHEG
ncbi:MAG: queuosine precursor transporter [Acidobacteria bacterium]|nr:queuosine precursor transporter [Acidobacteriota bacterium]